MSLSKLKILTILAFTLILIGCVEFKKVTLYEGVEKEVKPDKPQRIGDVVEPVIFNDNTTDMWGLEKTVCKDASLETKDVYSGKSAIKLSWDRNVSGCNFAGIGIGWDSYAGKDLTNLMDYAAIKFYVRAQKDKMFSLPIVLTLEDYSGGMGFAYTANKYFERTSIDTSWQKVEVPLSAFDLETENLDVSNIKQLQLELQQSGDIYLDDIELVFYTPEKMEPWMEEDSLPDPLATPIQIFDDSFINHNGWGLVVDDCQKIALTTAENFSSNSSIYAKWHDTDNCKVTGFGASWNKWKPVDASNEKKNLFIQFQLKNTGQPQTELNIYVGLEDYDRRKATVQLKSKYVQGGVYNRDWNTVTIPFKSLPKDFDYSHIKQMIFDMKDQGEVYIDDIRLVREQSN